ncbi:GatB/YqeY domain-containing protein [Pseudomonas aeruginosa]|uniref:GatB/YqeY domain-containing protein n=1 Tax=Pseudomonas aeruginosa TaxID=287 RepID=UPI0013CE397C
MPPYWTRNLNFVIVRLFQLGGSLIGSSGDSNNNSSSKSSSEEKDAESLDEICKIVVETLVEEREALKKNPKVFGAFVGEVMKRTKGRADPKLVSSTIKHLLRDYD